MTRARLDRLRRLIRRAAAALTPPPTTWPAWSRVADDLFHAATLAQREAERLLDRHDQLLRLGRRITASRRRHRPA